MVTALHLMKNKDTSNNIRFLFQKSDLHNSSFIRAWPKTNIITIFALKNRVDLTTQKTNISSDKPFHEDIDF